MIAAHALFLKTSWEPAFRRQCVRQFWPIPLPIDWKDQLASEQKSPTDTLYDLMRRLRQRLREEDYEATTGLTNHADL